MKKYLFLILGIIISLILIFPVSGWYDGYQYRQIHNITGSSTWTNNQNMYQVTFTLMNTSGISSGGIAYTNGTSASDWSDIQFTNTTDDLPFSFNIDDTNATSATVTVKIPAIINSTTATQIYFYYGKSGETSASSGKNTYELFDDFNAGSLNMTIWNFGHIPTSFSTYNFTSGALNIYGGTPTQYYTILSKSTFGTNYALRGRIQTSHFGCITYHEEFGLQNWTTSKGQLVRLAWSDTGWGAKYSNYDGTANTGTSIPSWNVNTWHITEIRRGATSAKFQTDRQSEITISSNYYAINGSVLFSAGYDNLSRISIDWVGVRKYNDIEPIHSTWGIVENNAPSSILNLLSSVSNSSITWNWTNPTDSNFNLTMVWKDGSFDQNITNSSHGLTWSGLSPHTTHTISTKTVSINGYVNSTWVNGTATTDYSSINANFTGTPLTGIAPLTVSFSDLSSDTPSNWLWNFGDGNISSLQNPSNTYSVPGVYSVSLNASNPQFFSNFTRTNYITVTAPTTSPTPTPTTTVPTTTSTTSPTPTPTPLPGGQWIIFTDNITQSSITWNMSNKAAPLTFVSLDGVTLTGYDPNATTIIQLGLQGGETHSISAIANNTTATATATTTISIGDRLVNLVSDWFPVFIILGLFAFGLWLHWLIFFIGSGVSLYFLYDWIQRYPIQTVGITNLHFLVYAALFILGLILWLFKRKGR